MNLTINALNTSDYPATTTLVGASNCTITINGVDHAGVNTYTASITNNTSVSIKIAISGGGVYDYTNTITVFDYDLTINVFMVTIVTDPFEANYKESFAYINTYVKPCSFSIYAVNGSSYPSGVSEYYLDYTLVSNDVVNNIFNLDSARGVLIQFLKETTTYYSYVTLTEYRPEVSVSLTANSTCGNTSCITKGNTFTATPNIVLNLNNQTTPTCAESTLTYTLTNINNVVVDSVTYTIDNTVTPIDIAALIYQSGISEVGDYTLTTTLENCCAICTDIRYIKNCEFISIEETSTCHIFTIINNRDAYNTDNNPPYVKISIYDTENNIINSIENYQLNNTTSTTVTFTKDGVYKVKVVDSLDVLIGWFIIIDYCDIKSCLTSKLQSILCSCDCGCEDCVDYSKKRFSMNRILPLTYLLFGYANAEYSMNSIYTALDSAKIIELSNVNNVIEKLTDYCDCCDDCSSDTNTQLNNNIIGNTNTSDCGCN